MTFVVAGACVDVKDRTCLDQCPVDCIYEGSRKVYIQPEECIDCGACEPVCPVNAIFPASDVPDVELAHVEANLRFFDELGSPGGFELIGPQDFDCLPDQRLDR